MSTDWTPQILSSVLAFSNGKTSPSRGDKLPFNVFGSNGIIGKSDKTNSEENTIVIGRVGSYCGSLYFSHQRCWVTDNAIKAVAKGDNDPRYLYYLLQTLGLNNYRAGSGQPLLNQSILGSIKTVIPKPNTQKAIAHILGCLDDKIDVNLKINSTLEAMAQCHYKSWFVDFEPVKEKLEKRWKKGLSRQGLPAEYYDLFPGDLQTIEETSIPKGWDFAPASSVIEFNPTESLAKGKDAPYLDMASLPTKGSWPNRWIIRAFGSGMKFRNGDTLLARITPCLENGKTALIQSLPEDTVGWGSTEFIVMRPKTGITKVFPYLLARDELFRAHTIRSMTGTSGRQRAQAEVVSNYSLAMPPNPDQIFEVFKKFVDPIFEKIKATSEEIETLVELRNTLIPQLALGKIKLNDVEQFLKEHSL